MLYATTRSKTDSYTDYRTLFEDRAPNGGFFLPMRLPRLEHTQLLTIKEQSFGETVAFILNLFYTGRITSWDVDCSVGKNPVKVISVDHRVLLAKLWDNPQGEYRYLCTKLYEKLCAGERKELTDWANIAIRIAVLFGVYGIVQKSQIKSFDISVNTGDFSDPMAAWYAREMGLPIGRIICTCNETNLVWDFLHRGELNAAMLTSELNASNPTGIERLIFHTLGLEHTQNYLEISFKGDIYRVSPEHLRLLNDGMFVSVVGKDRPESVISAFYGANDIILDPNTALSYGGLQDYRSKAGESTPTVLLWDNSPIHSASTIQRSTGLGKYEIEKHIEKY